MAKPTWTKNPKVERARQEARERDELARRDLELAPRPNDEGMGPPGLPEDVSALSDDALVRMMTVLSGWADYLEAELAAAEVHERGCNDILEVIEAEGLIRNWGESGSVNVAKARAKVSSSEVVEARDQAQVAYARRKYLTTIFNRAERGAALLSRELTRRLGREQVTRRADRYST